jgi:sec-independent protein translocase protein TatB
MFDFGWQEFLVIAFVLVLVVGPKDLPRVLKTVTQYLRNMRQMASEFHRGIEKMADEADLKDVKQSFNDINNKNFDKTLQNHLDPENEVSKALHQNNVDLNLNYLYWPY